MTSITTVGMYIPKNAIGDDGKVMIVKPNEVKYDTLSNGRIIARNLPGQLAKVAVDDQETYLRPNFSQSDNRGYRVAIQDLPVSLTDLEMI